MNRSREERLEATLRAIAPHAEYPPTPPLAESVRRRIEADGILPRRVTRRPAWRPLVAASAIVALAFGTLLAFSPRAREAVADFIGLGGVRIEYGEPPTRSIPTDDLGLGPRISLDQAEDRARFEVKLPGLVGLPPPQVHFTEPPDGGMVSLVYARDGEPALLVTQFEADLNGDSFKKFVGGDTNVDYVTVRGRPGYWVRGAHYFLYTDQAGRVQEESVRLAANVLLWEEDGITYRIEGSFGRAEALEVADSLND